MTIEQRMEHLEFEIERLNLRNRRWRWLTCTMAVLIVAGVIVASVGIGVAQMNEDELTLRKLVIQDEEGRKRIELFAHGLGADIVHLDTNGKTRINSITAADGDAGTYHYDETGKMRIRSATLMTGNALTIWSEYDANGKPQIVKALP